MSREHRAAGKRGLGKRKQAGVSGKTLSAKDLERIEVPAGLKRREDRVLAFCHKYWLAADDPGFEKLVRDYAEQNGSFHYDIFQAIRDGRARGLSDDEVLNRVSGILSPGYAYSVEGDLYTQQVWRVIKAKMAADAAPVRESAPPPKTPKPVRTAEKGGKTAPDPSTKPRKNASGTRKSASERRRKAQTACPETSPAKTPTGSISDRIKRLACKRYDVYREEFLGNVRPSIAAWLDSHRAKPKAVFEDSLNKAEDLIYEYLRKNYSNPYMDWEASEIRMTVEAMGFSVPSLDGIIVRWFEGR